VEGAELMLVTPSAEQFYSGMVPGLVAGRYQHPQCAIDVAALAAAARVHLVRGHAVALDADARGVRLDDGRVAEYELLSIDIGATIDHGRIPGAAGNASFVRPIGAFARSIGALTERAAQQPLDIVVVGAGAAGVELALALERRLRSTGTRLALVGPEILAGYPARARRLAVRALAARRITCFPDRCVAIEPGLALLAGGARLACDLAVVATGGEAPPWLAGSGLALDADGYVRAGPTLQSVSHPEVLAVGDVARRDGAPQMHGGVHAVRAAPALARNLRLLARCAAPRRYRPPQRTLSLIACGDGTAIAAWGGWSARGRWAGWCKDLIDRAYVRRHRAGFTVPSA
jgi:NADH dehydrogenase FAD-containing subunit